MSYPVNLRGVNCDAPPTKQHIDDYKLIATCEWDIPLAWLALFAVDDVFLIDMENPGHSQSRGEPSSYQCATAFASKEKALSSLRQRIKSYSGHLTVEDLQYYVILEAEVSRCSARSVQIVVSEAGDSFLSYPDAGLEKLKSLITSINTCDPEEWSYPVSFFPDADIGETLKDISFDEQDMKRSALFLGYSLDDVWET